MVDELKEIREKKLQEMRENFGKPIEITDRNFQEIITKNNLVIVDCWAPWCGPCKMIAPSIDELAKRYAGKVVFAKLNTDDNQETAIKFGIMAIPTLLFFKGGKLVDKTVGALPKNAIEGQVKKHL